MRESLLVMGPALALASGVVGVLGFGMARVRAVRIAGIAALLAAAALAAAGAPGSAGPLIKLDALGLSWQLLFVLGALPLVALSPNDDEVPAALILASVLGMALLAAAASLLMAFIAFELMSLPAYLLVARRGGRRGLEAALKYFFAGGLASGVLLMGIALHYAAAGSLAFVPATGVFAEAGLALMGVAALFKVGIVPLHFWLPDVYEAAEPELAGFLSTAMKAAAVLFLARLAMLAPASVFTATLPYLGAMTAAFGAILALRQQRLQRLLAYSSIGHAGALVLGVGAWASRPSATGAAAVFFYLVAYLFMSNGAFLFLRAAGARERGQLKGLARRDPAAAAAFAVLLLSLAAVPPTAGFMAKFAVFWEAAKSGLFLPVAVAAGAAVVSLAYYLGMIQDMYFEAPGEGGPEPVAGSLALVWLCAIAAALLGLAPGLLDFLARRLA